MEYTVEDRLYVARRRLLIGRFQERDPQRRRLLRQMQGLLRQVYRKPDDGAAFRRACKKAGELSEGEVRVVVCIALRALACRMLRLSKERLENLPILSSQSAPEVCRRLLELLDRQLEQICEVITSGCQESRYRSLPQQIWGIKIVQRDVRREVRLLSTVLRGVEEANLALLTAKTANASTRSLNGNGSRRRGRTPNEV